MEVILVKISLQGTRSEENSPNCILRNLIKGDLSVVIVNRSNRNVRLKQHNNMKLGLTAFQFSGTYLAAKVFSWAASQAYVHLTSL